MDDLAKQVQAELLMKLISYFKEHKAEFGQVEERQASHILLSAPTTASDTDKAAARSKAEELILQIKQAPQNFADLAKQHSQDAGSADKGGDLGFFGRGYDGQKLLKMRFFKWSPKKFVGQFRRNLGFILLNFLQIKVSEKKLILMK